MKKFLSIALALMLTASVACASVSNQTNKVFGSGDNTTVIFNYPFKIFGASELLVYKIDADGTVHGPLTLNSDYTVTISTSSEGGTVVFTVAPTATQTTLIKRIEPLTQSLKIATEGPLPAKQIENALDLQTMTLIQFNEILSRCLQYSGDLSTLPSSAFPTPVASNIIGWDATGSFLQNYVMPTITTLPIAQGGTGATTAPAALTNLGAQAALVSGTNIKTITSNSLLGSGDISLSSLVGYTPAHSGANSDISSLSGLDHLSMNSAASTTQVLDVAANSLTTGVISYLYSNSADTSSRYLLEITNDSALATGTVPFGIIQNSTFYAGYLQTAGYGLYIITSGTTQKGLNIEGDDLTTGNLGYFYSNSADTSTRNLVQIINDNNAATGTIPLSITQVAVVSTHFKKVISAAGVTIWVSDGSTPNAALSGTAGDVCLNCDSGKTYHCTSSTSWVSP